MTSSLPPALTFRQPDAGKRAAQRVINAEALALGFAALGVWTYAVLTFVSG